MDGIRIARDAAVAEVLCVRTRGPADSGCERHGERSWPRGAVW
jgi:hypothetical protein